MAGRRDWESGEKEVGSCCPRCRKEKADRVRLQSRSDGYMCKEQSGSESAEGILCLYTEKNLGPETSSLAWETFSAGCLLRIVFIFFSHEIIRKRPGEAPGNCAEPLPY